MYRKLFGLCQVLQIMINANIWQDRRNAKTNGIRPATDQSCVPTGILVQLFKQLISVEKSHRLILRRECISVPGCGWPTLGGTDLCRVTVSNDCDDIIICITRQDQARGKNHHHLSQDLSTE